MSIQTVESKDLSVGKDTAVSRAARDLLAFEDWTSKAIVDRQTMLTRLAVRTWDMPLITS